MVVLRLLYACCGVHMATHTYMYHIYTKIRIISWERLVAAQGERWVGINSGLGSLPATITKIPHVNMMHVHLLSRAEDGA